LTDGVEILHREFIAGDPERETSFQVTQEEMEVGRQIYQLRTEAGMSQAELAQRIGTTQSVISRLEDAEYEGHSMAMLRRIAAALGKRVVIGFVDLEAAASSRFEAEPLQSEETLA